MFLFSSMTLSPGPSAAVKVPSAPEGPLGLMARGGLVLMVLRGSLWSLRVLRLQRVVGSTGSLMVEAGFECFLGPVQHKQTSCKLLVPL